MQDFRDSGEKNGGPAAISVKFVTGYAFVRYNILFYIDGPVILHFLSYKIQNGL